ncbi:Uncharacterised protein [Salmonella enterica subsp. enterica serovar Bovismorbificans]|nr:Uncharacterised protein [Salmonella enterica subsp. enterica serovar Bovismorbificans]
MEIGFGFKAFSHFSRKGFEFLFVHNCLSLLLE